MKALRVELDGSHGEGGGQVLRTALSLSMITGTPFRIERIRSRRARPGLLRQHLTAVQAAAAICGAEVGGAELGSLALTFTPGPIRQMRVLPSDQGPGNVVLVEMEYEQVTEVFTGFGEKGQPAESVADGVARAARLFHQGEAAVDEYLADQLLLPMALAGRGAFTASRLSSHLRTNIEVIEKFLDVKFQLEESDKLATVSL